MKAFSLRLGFRLLPALSVLLGVLISPAHAQQRHALVIGNGAYQTARKLPNAPKDARDVASALSVAGWKVTKVEDSGIKDLLRALREFCESAKGAEAALFFYAGHGIEVKGKNYLLPVDASLGENDGEDALPLETLAVDKVLADLGNAGIALKTVVLDSCRNDPMQRSWLVSRSSGGGLAEIAEKALPEGTMLVYSTAPGKTASDGRGANSPFTAALLARMKAGGGGVADVFGDVAVAMGQGQEAWIRFDGSGRSFAAFRAYPLLPGAVPESQGMGRTPPRLTLSYAKQLISAREIAYDNARPGKDATTAAYQHQPIAILDALFPELIRISMDVFESKMTQQELEAHYKKLLGNAYDLSINASYNTIDDRINACWSQVNSLEDLIIEVVRQGLRDSDFDQWKEAWDDLRPGWQE